MGEVENKVMLHRETPFMPVWSKCFTKGSQPMGRAVSLGMMPHLCKTLRCAMVNSWSNPTAL